MDPTVEDEIKGRYLAGDICTNRESQPDHEPLLRRWCCLAGTVSGMDHVGSTGLKTAICRSLVGMFPNRRLGG